MANTPLYSAAAHLAVQGYGAPVRTARENSVFKFRTFRHEGLFDLMSWIYIVTACADAFLRQGQPVHHPSPAVLGFLVLEQIGYWLNWRAGLQSSCSRYHRRHSWSAF